MYGTERLHRPVLYYESNEYLMKYTGTLCVLPKAAVAPAQSQCFSLSYDVSSATLTGHTFTFKSLCSPARASYRKQSGFCPTHMWVGMEGRTHSNLFNLRAGMARRCEPVQSFEKFLPAVLCGIHMTTQLQQCTHLHIHIRNKGTSFLLEKENAVIFLRRNIWKYCEPFKTNLHFHYLNIIL
jgi:hypothetical protein